MNSVMNQSRLSLGAKGCLLLLCNFLWFSNPLFAEEILSVGDSITSGLKRNSGGTFLFCPADDVVTSGFYVCNGNGVVNKGGFQPDVRSLLAAESIDANVYNWGFAGEESWQIVTRVNQAMDSRSADYVFIMAGVNDLNDNVSVGTTVFNVQQMALNVEARGLKPILGSLTPHLGNAAYPAKISLINDAIEAFAEENDFAYANHYQDLIANWAIYHSGDNLHLSNAGDAVVAQNWVEAFNQANEPPPPTFDPSIFILLLD